MTKAQIQPKAEFMADGQRADRHMEIVLSPDFRDNCEVAMLQYMYELPLTQGAEILQLKGAREYLDILRNLGQKSVHNSKADEESLIPT